MKRLKAMDVCAGGGGWAVSARGLPIDIVAAFDREPLYLKTYKQNHPRVECIECDVLTFDGWDAFAGVDLVLGALPCEQISPARANIPPSEVEFEQLRTLAKVLLGLPERLGATHWCFEDVIQVIPYLPLMTPNFVEDAKWFSGQNRKRAWIGNVPRPRRPNDTRVLRDYLRSGPFRVSARLEGREPNTHGKLGFYPWEPSKKSPTVIQLTSRQDAHAAVRCGDGWRQLEWQELAALQGFPADYVFVGPPNKVMKQIAQAVQIDIARAILEALCREIKKGRRKRS